MEYTVTIQGQELAFATTPGIFSPRRADEGTLAMLSCAALSPGDTLLDLGCGCGIVGVWAARTLGAGNVWMCDVDPEAVRIARENAARNGVGGVTCVVSDAYEGVDRAGFQWILCNPPYQTDFSVAKRFIEKGFNRLALGGQMLMVTKRRLWYENKLKTVFGGVRTREIGGYFVFTAVRRSWDSPRFRPRETGKKGGSPGRGDT